LLVAGGAVAFYLWRAPEVKVAADARWPEQ
jgi:hypothetical protein